MPYDIVDRGKIEELVRAFYAEILKDDLVGPIFVKALGEDMNTGKWYEHLQTLYNFWLLMMTGDAPYRGHPFPPHAFLGPLSHEMFERWLKLFHETVHTYFVPEIAEKFYSKADLLAEQFMENLGLNDEDDDD